MLRKLLTPIEDDTEDAPWTVMGTPQWDAVSAFYASLRADMRSRDEPLFVAAMLPIRYYPIPGGRIEQLAPDILVARARREVEAELARLHDELERRDKQGG